MENSRELEAAAKSLASAPITAYLGTQALRRLQRTPNRCVVCEKVIPVPPAGFRGRPPTICSEACQVLRRRQHGRRQYLQDRRAKLVGRRVLKMTGVQET